MKIPEPRCHECIDIILSFSSPKNIRSCFVSLHSTDSIFHYYTNTGYQMIFFFLFLSQWILLGILLWYIGICVDMLNSLISTINKYSNFLWYGVDDVCLVDLFLVMKFSVFCRREIKNLLGFVSNDSIFSPWSFLFP